MRELLPLRNLLQEIGKNLKFDFIKHGLIQSTVFEDNNEALGLATSPKLTPQTKHIAVKYHFFRSHISDKKETIKESEFRESTQKNRLQISLPRD